MLIKFKTDEPRKIPLFTDYSIADYYRSKANSRFKPIYQNAWIFPPVIKTTSLP